MDLILLLLSLINHTPTILHETHDIVEVNSIYAIQGDVTMTQIIWWDYNPRINKYQIADWRLVPTIRRLTLKDIIANQNLSFKEMADKCGIKTLRMQEIIIDSSIASTSERRIIAKALKVDVSDIDFDPGIIQWEIKHTPILPTKVDGYYISTFFDKKGEVMRRIRAKTYTRTAYDFDVEIYERAHLEQEQRVKLRKNVHNIIKRITPKE